MSGPTSRKTPTRSRYRKNAAGGISIIGGTRSAQSRPDRPSTACLAVDLDDVVAAPQLRLGDMIERMADFAWIHLRIGDGLQMLSQKRLVGQHEALVHHPLQGF